MIILITGIILLILGIIGINKGFLDWWEEIGIIGTIFGSIILAFCIAFLIYKQVTYKRFIAEYNTIKEISTSKEDLRDATYTNRIIDINEQINTCREFKDSLWVGIYQNK